VDVTRWVAFHRANPTLAVKQARFAFGPSFSKELGIRLRRNPDEVAFSQTIRKIAAGK
jgi:hypothetical protein